jgi:hypothetical protein
MHWRGTPVRAGTAGTEHKILLSPREVKPLHPSLGGIAVEGEKRVAAGYEFLPVL